MKKNTIFIIIVVLLLGSGVYFFSLGNDVSDDAALQVQVNPEIQSSATRVLTLLNQIRSLKIDPTLFSSLEYRTLRDYSVTIPTLDVGRLNPFAPLANTAPPTAPVRRTSPSQAR